MKRKLVAGIALLALTCAPAAASAQTSAHNGFSMGLILGDPTGLTLRNGLGDSDAVQAHFGWSSYPGDAMAVMADWTRDAWDFLHGSPSVALLFYFGVGGKLQSFTGRYYTYDRKHERRLPDDSHFGLGVRGLVGLRMPFRKAPFDLFLELAPIGIIFVPNAGAYYDADLALGARYRF